MKPGCDGAIYTEQKDRVRKRSDIDIENKMMDMMDRDYNFRRSDIASCLTFDAVDTGCSIQFWYRLTRPSLSRLNNIVTYAVLN
jgi:hypothetical protein